MPAIVIGVLLAVAAYGLFCWAVIVFVFLPAWPFLVLAGAATGVILIGSTLAGTLLQLGGLGAVTLTPADVRSRLPKPRSRFERDRAWPNYLFAQSRTDLATALDHTGRRLGRVWEKSTMPLQEEPAILWAWPLLLLPLVFLLGLTVAAVLSGFVVYGVVCVVLGVAWAGWGIVAGFRRTVEYATQRLRGAKATCTVGGCNHRNRLPAYRCGGCGQVHHDIRAGRLGAFTRRCSCGTMLPTTVLNAGGLAPICQLCGEPLRPGAAMLTDVVLPVFGPTSAGKTRFVLAGMVALARHLTAAGGSLRPVGPESETAFDDARGVVASRADTAKTAAGRPPAGLTVRLTTARRQGLLHLFDAAGEFYSTREQAGDLPFLDDADGFVFVLDPFSIPEVRQQLTGPLAARLDTAHPASMNPEQSYLVTTRWLRDQGVCLDRKPLAVAVVKSDLLLDLPAAAGLRAPAEPAEIMSWLREKGLDNMLDGAGRDFAAVRCFLVSSLEVASDADGWAGPASPAHPLLWLLGRSRMSIPAAPPLAVAGRTA